MGITDLLQRAHIYYLERGILRTVGTTARYIGCKINNRFQAFADILERDRGKGYSWRLRLKAARHGFSAESYCWLGLENKNPEKYLNNSRLVGEVGRRYSGVFRNKYHFQKLSEPHSDNFPEIYVKIQGERTRNAADTSQNKRRLRSILEEHKKVLVKPDSGSQGEDIKIIEKIGDQYLMNRYPITATDVDDLESALTEHIVSEFIQQHEYVESIYPDATNTIRVFTLYRSRDASATVISAAHRFGSEKSAPTDNLSRGGYCAPIDIETGELGKLIAVSGSGHRSVHEKHPETKEQVAGVKVPNWEEVIRTACELTELHWPAHIIAWDIVVNEQAHPIILEGNTGGGIHLLQLEQGILENEDVRRVLSEKSPL